jgi:hypothetical protein
MSVRSEKGVEGRAEHRGQVVLRFVSEDEFLADQGSRSILSGT